MESAEHRCRSLVLNHFETCIILHRLPNGLTHAIEWLRRHGMQAQQKSLAGICAVPAGILARQVFQDSNVDPFELVRNGTSIADLGGGYQ